ncbi:MAG: hypothetical protein II798_08660 [Lachnospiraceae bacterium]|nr:hypothetical protein [Lachnospiraceae bacterium]
MEEFKKAYLMGKLEFEDIDDYIEEWGELEGDDRTLREFLGLTVEEEDAWIDEGDDALKAMLEKQRKNPMTLD